jgi:hypothetical protein
MFEKQNRAAPLPVATPAPEHERPEDHPHQAPPEYHHSATGTPRVTVARLRLYPDSTPAPCQAPPLARCTPDVSGSRVHTVVPTVRPQLIPPALPAKISKPPAPLLSNPHPRRAPGRQSPAPSLPRPATQKVPVAARPSS